MLLLFVMFSIGLAGIWARRKHNIHKRLCHRGVSANFFMAAIGIYFLITWAILIGCILLMVPNVFLRQVVCRPSTDLENSKLVQVCINKIKPKLYKNFKCLK